MCPVRIDLAGLLVEQRSRNVRPSRLERLGVKLFVFMMSSESRYLWFSRLAYWLARPFVREGRIKRLPLFSNWTRFRDFPAPKGGARRN